MKKSNISIKENSENEKYVDKCEFLDPDKNLLWKLHLGRKEAFEAMNNDVDEIVNQCRAAKRHLQAVEDSNIKLKQEMRSLRSKYEALLEKNRKDTGIIMRLKDSESLLKEATKNRKSTSESLLEIQIKNKEKTLERNLLQNDRDKLVFRSQAITNILRKKNLKHKHLYELILDENRKYKENNDQFVQETQQLKYILGKNDSILKKWIKDNAERDAAIRQLQDDMKAGLITHREDIEEDATVTAASSVVSEFTDKAEIPQSNGERSGERNLTSVDAKSDISQNDESQKLERNETAFRKDWLSKKTLFEVAEKQKEHLVDFYVILNKRMKSLNVEILNVKAWLVDKQAEKREIWEKTFAMEKLVSEKRRQRPVPLRTSTKEIEIWIEVQREANDALRKIAYKCLSVKLEDSVMYSEFSRVVKNAFLGSLKDHFTLEPITPTAVSEEKQDEEKV